MDDHTETTPFGQLLRRRRNQRRLTQERLAYRADLSARHVSFLETGRSNPSRSSVLSLARALDLPLRDRNALLRAAGFAAVYPDRDLVTSDESHVRALLSFLLRRHEPFPAYVVDRTWTVRRHNRAAVRVISWLLDQPAEEDGERPASLEGVNLLRTLFDPAALRPLTVNFDEVGRFLLDRLEQEIALRPDDERLQELLEEVESYGPVPEAFSTAPDEADDPALPVHLRKDDVDVRMLSFIMTVAAPRDAGLEDIRMETFLPADPESEAVLRQLADGEGEGRKEVPSASPP